MKVKSYKYVIAYTLLILLSILFIFPTIWLILSSLKPSSELFSGDFSIIPKTITFDNYINAFKRLNYFQYLFNTTFVAVVATILTIAISAFGGYSLAKYKYKYLNVLFILLLTMQMLPTEIIMRPTFEVIKSLGLYNSLWGIIIPTINTMTGILLMRQFFLTVPDSILESARIDGASEYSIFFRIMLPLAKTPIAILTIFSIQWRWNDFIWPLIVISDPKKYTLQLALSNLVGEFYIDWSLLIPASVLTLIPTFIIFIIFQKRIMEGLASTGSKES